MQLGLMNKEQASQMVFGRPAEGNIDDILTAYGKVENMAENESDLPQDAQNEPMKVNTPKIKNKPQNAK